MYTSPAAGLTRTTARSVRSSAPTNSPLAVTASGNVDANVAGSYTLRYVAVDPSGNGATNSRTVTVVDTTPPRLIGVPLDATYQCLSEVPTMPNRPHALRSPSARGPPARLRSRIAPPLATEIILGTAPARRQRAGGAGAGSTTATGASSATGAATAACSTS